MIDTEVYTQYRDEEIHYRRRFALSVAMSLLALLEAGPTYGLQLKHDFERCTSGSWPMNVGQIYSTLQRLQRDGLVEAQSDPGIERNKMYGVTDQGRLELEHWFATPLEREIPARDELVMKVMMVVCQQHVDKHMVIQGERRSVMQLLQEYTRQKHDIPDDADVAWLLLMDWLIFQAEATLRWLDACETHFSQWHRRPDPEPSGGEHPHMDVEEVSS